MRQSHLWRIALVSLTFTPGFLGAKVDAETVVFSGPQVGEILPSFHIELVSGPTGETHHGESATKSGRVDPVKAADNGPVLLVFFHELTRPGFSLIRSVSRFATTRTDQGLESTVIFLTDDTTATRQWTSQVNRYFVDGVNYAISEDGPEGPGAYGLNRNVTLTILVGNKGRVTDNFALVQPQLQADGPEILKAIAKITGGGEIPDVAKLNPQSSSRRMSREPERKDARDRSESIGD